MKKFITKFFIFISVITIIFFQKNSVFEYILFQINSKKAISWGKYVKKRVKSYQKITRNAADEFLAAIINGDYQKAEIYWYRPIISTADNQEKNQFDKNSRTIAEILNKIKHYEHVDSWVWVIKSGEKKSFFNPAKKTPDVIIKAPIPKAKIHLFASNRDFPGGHFSDGIYYVEKYLADFEDLGQMELFLFLVEPVINKKPSLKVVVLKGPKPVIIGLHERTSKQFNIDTYDKKIH